MKEMFSHLIGSILSVPVLLQFMLKAKCGLGLSVGWRARCINGGKKEAISIGDNCQILGRLECNANGKILIGSHSTIRYATYLGAADSISIGEYCIISNNCTIFDNNNHPTSPRDRLVLSASGFGSKLWGWEFSDAEPVCIEDNVWIGQNSTILKGVTIGRGSIVAACSVVTRSVPAYCIVAGNPARVVKSLRDELQKFHSI